MNGPERLCAAYNAIESAAPDLVVGNDASSGFAILAHAAINGLQQLNPAKAKALLASWQDTIEESLALRAERFAPSASVQELT